MRKRSLFIGFLISAGCLYFAFKGLSFREVGQALRQADPCWLAAALGIYSLGFAVRSIRWKGLMTPIQVLPASQLIRPMVIGFFANNVLPFRMGEVVRAIVTAQKFNISRTAVLGNIVLERIFDTISFLTIFLVTTVFFPFPGPVKHAAYVLALACAGAIVALLLACTHQAKANALLARLPIAPVWRLKLSDVLANFAHGISGITKGGYIVQGLILSMVVWGIEGTMVFFVAHAFPISITYPQAFFLLFFLGLSVTLPQAPGYVGTVELFGVMALSLLGVPKDQGLPVILTLHGLQFSFIAFLGCLALWKEGLSLGRLLNRAEISTN